MIPPALSRAEALRLLAALDVPSCDCPIRWLETVRETPAGSQRLYHPVPCAHVLACRDHGLDLDEWAELQRLLCPLEYAERPPPEAPGGVLSRRAIVEVYHQRWEAQRHLYHERDLWRRQPTDDQVEAGPQVRRAGNGADVQGEVTTRRPAE